MALVRYRNNDYSVPTHYGHREVLAKGYVDQVEIVCGGETIAVHARSFDKAEFIYNPLHYLALLEHKSRALDRACFIPAHDLIEIPHQGFFKSPEAFYAVALHELAHWSGHTSRLNRDLSGRFGWRAYAAEELIAELAAAFLCAHLGVRGELRHAGYIGSWLELLKHDDRAIFTAASKASISADYLRAFSEPATSTQIGDIVAAAARRQGLRPLTAC